MREMTVTEAFREMEEQKRLYRVAQMQQPVTVTLELADALILANVDNGFMSQAGRDAMHAFRVQVLELDPDRVTLYTNADDGFDGFGTVTLETEVTRDRRGLTVRRVSVRRDALEWQCNRYGSGLRFGMTAEVFERDRDLIETRMTAAEARSISVKAGE